MYADGIAVRYNGNPIEFDVEPQIINERVMVPMRSVFESFNAKVDWFEKSQLILVAYKDNILSIEIGSDKMYNTNLTSGTAQVLYTDTPAMIINERTLVPIRAVSESTGKTVQWDEQTQTVDIFDK